MKTQYEARNTPAIIPSYGKPKYSLTPRSRVLLEKLTGFAANQEIPRILWNNPKVLYRTHKRPATCPYPEPIPSSPHTPFPLPHDPS